MNTVQVTSILLSIYLPLNPEYISILCDLETALRALALVQSEPSNPDTEEQINVLKVF